MKSGEIPITVRGLIALIVAITLIVGAWSFPEQVRATNLWHTETVDSEGNTGAYTSIALDVNGNPHISYLDSSNLDLKYAWKDSGGWHLETVDSEGYVGKYTSLALDASGNPHISYYDYDKQDLKYARRDSGGWHLETVDSEGHVGEYASLALDASGNPHISYYDYDKQDLKYARKDSGGWHTEIPDSVGDVGLDTSIALGADGNPHISYYDWDLEDLKYAWKDSGGWHTEIVDIERIIGGTSLALDADGNPHISYFDVTLNDLKYAWKDSGGWNTEIPDSAGSGLDWASLALDADGNPHISYCDYNAEELKYLWKDSGGWHIQHPDSAGHTGSYNSLALDVNGNPHISYYEFFNRDLKYAWVTTDPRVSTAAVSDITGAGAISGGNITFDGEEAVTARGVCWNTTGAPTTADTYTADGAGAGSFISNLTGLTPGTTYYLRAYATNLVGTSYGEELSFTTHSTPGVTTDAITGITTGSATSGGNVTSDGGDAVTARGICWNASGSPTISDAHTSDGTGTGEFTSSLTGLSLAATYYVRAYATNSVGTSYGEELTFTTAADPLSTWYLAEGSTDWGFDCYISIANPNEEEVRAKFTYMTSSGPVTGSTVNMPALSQATVFPSATLGAADFSTKVECLEGKAISVDRTMFWTGPTSTVGEAHCSSGVTNPENTWYLPEGSTGWGFETWLLLQNPGKSNTSCTVTWMIEGAEPHSEVFGIKAGSRLSIDMAEHVGSVDASIEVTSDSPVVAERAMYRNDRREGHASTGTSTAASDYYLAEGCTGFGFTTYVLVQNPNSEEAEVTVTYQATAGEVEGPTFTMPANSRHTICVNDTTAIPGDDPSFSAHVHSSAPIIAERAMYWNGGDDGAQVCHDSIGLAAPHRTWYLADGQTSEGRETFTLVQNPNAEPVTVQITYLTTDGAGNVTKTETIAGGSRKSFNMAEHSGISGRAAIMVVSQASGLKVMVERAMYWNKRGSGTDTMGGYSD